MAIITAGQAFTPFKRAAGRSIIYLSILLAVCLILFLPPFRPAGTGRTALAADGQSPDRPAAGSVISNQLGMTFAYIPPGSFMMGSPLSETGRERNEFLHPVTLTKGFYLQTTEVTQGQWRMVMGSNPSHFSDCGDDCPVERVSLAMVRVFIDRLNGQQSQLRYRLPTEAEWEYACRAGSITALNNGDIRETGCGLDPNLDKMGWYCGNSEGTTHPAARKAPNAWGLFDMHGNVFEWTADWYGNYPLRPVTDPTGPVPGRGWVIRGGCWKSYARYCRSADRSRFQPDFRNRYIGFRLAVSR